MPRKQARLEELQKPVEREYQLVPITVKAPHEAPPSPLKARRPADAPVLSHTSTTAPQSDNGYTILAPTTDFFTASSVHAWQKAQSLRFMTKTKENGPLAILDTIYKWPFSGPL